MKKLLVSAIVTAILPMLTACEPERGSDQWCEKMDETPKGEWTLNDATDYTKYCVFNQKPEKE